VKRLIPAMLTGTLVAGALLGLSSAASAQTAGSLDPTFGNAGVVLTNLGLNSGGSQIEAEPSAAALLSNGDILVSGNFGLVRYLPNGTLDTTFGTDGVAALPSQISSLFGVALAVQPNGQIVLAAEGTVPSGTNGDFSVIRYDANGSIDTTFGTGGVASTAFANSGVQGPSTILVQSNGDILVAGEALLDSYHAPAEAAMARFTANGTIDSTFGTDGQVTNLKEGDFSTLGEDASGDIFVLPGDIEYSATGQLDSTVTPEPITVSSPGGGGAFESSGQYVVGSTDEIAKHNIDVEVRLFDAGGALAASTGPFNYSSTTTLSNLEDTGGAVAVQSNGQIVVAGAQYNFSTSVFGLARVNTNGSLDSGFGTKGTVLTTIQGDEGASAVLIQPNGDIVVVGYSEDNSTGVTDLALARYIG
jgi:uncharacterized delta-60 repeat protein